MLDSEDSTGIAGKRTESRSRERSKAHNGSVNGISWTENGHHLVTAGHDECVVSIVDTIVVLHGARWPEHIEHVTSAFVKNPA